VTPGAEADAVEVRESRPEDVHLAAAASRLIDLVAEGFDIARRTPEWLAQKIEAGRAALALDDGELVGFGYWSAWGGGAFASHSGLVVHPDRMGRGLGRRLKMVLFESTRRQLPRATMMSLTTSEQVKRMNASLGFHVVPLDRLTDDPEFWKGCETCRNYAEVLARGERCCCEGMILEPPPEEDEAGDA
jgi:GNAT superfamily N-acetyltransferase